MSKFKVGDKVRALRGSGGVLASSYVVGRVYTVTALHPRYDKVPPRISTVDENGLANGWLEDQFELVSDPTVELDALIETAHRGQDATKRLLTDFRDQIEYGEAAFNDLKVLPNYPLDNGSGLVRSARIRRKPKKPAFEPLTIGAWRVTLNDGGLVIGCKTYVAKEVLEALRILTSGSANSWSDFMAKRKGVYHGSNNISWEDADKLLAALEKAGV